MPAAPLYILEETVIVSLHRPLGQHAQSLERAPTPGFTTQIFNPYGGEEEGTRGVHYSQVWQD